MQDSESGCESLHTALLLLYTRVRTFFSHDLWIIDLATVSPRKNWFLQPLRITLIALRGFFIDHNCWLKASALAYYSFLFFIPLLAITFALLKGFEVPNKIAPFFLENFLSPGSEDSVQKILDYIDNVKVGALGVIGVCFVIITTFLQLSTIEDALNVIWGVTDGRAFLRKFRDYVSMIVISPILLTIALSAGIDPLIEKLSELQLIGPAVASTVAQLFNLLPYFVFWLGLSFFYAYMPNTQVGLAPALLGGLIGGLFFQIAKSGYFYLQVGLSKYQAIYGALAQIPVLLVWMQISWAVILFGAEVTFACQHVLTNRGGRLMPIKGTPRSSSYIREWIACSFYFSLVEAFRSGMGPSSSLIFAQENRVSLPLVSEIVEILVRAKLLVEAADAPAHYLPGRDPSTITPWHVLHAVRHDEDDVMAAIIERGNTQATLLLAQIESVSEDVIGSRNMNQWVDDEEGSK